MGTIAVQCAVGESGRKAVTKLSGFDLNSMAVINCIPFGASNSGFFQINTGTTDNDENYTRTFTLATTDFGVENHKRMRFVYIGIDTDTSFTLSVKTDNQSWRNYSVTPPKTGLQRIKKSVGRNGQGRYWTFKISSTSPFRIDEIKVIFYVRPSGIVGY